MILAELNALDCHAFVNAIGWVFEDSPWVAERAWKGRPFASEEALHAAMVARVEAAPFDEKLCLLRAHPDLGVRARMSVASVAEQAGAGLEALTREEFHQLQSWNAEYREKFGFPFLYAVKGSTKLDILKALERRLGSSPEEEFEEALRQVYRIAGFRLREAVG